MKRSLFFISSIAFILNGSLLSAQDFVCDVKIETSVSADREHLFIRCDHDTGKAAYSLDSNGIVSLRGSFPMTCSILPTDGFLPGNHEIHFNSESDSLFIVMYRVNGITQYWERLELDTQGVHPLRERVASDSEDVILPISVLPITIHHWFPIEMTESVWYIYLRSRCGGYITYLDGIPAVNRATVLPKATDSVFFLSKNGLPAEFENFQSLYTR